MALTRNVLEHLITFVLTLKELKTGQKIHETLKSSFHIFSSFMWF